MLNKIRNIIAVLINDDAVVVSKTKVVAIINRNSELEIENELARNRINSLDEIDLNKEQLIERTKKLEYTVKMVLSLESAYIGKIRYLSNKKLYKNKTYEQFVEENPPKHKEPEDYKPLTPNIDNKEVFVSKITTSRIIEIAQDNGGINVIENKLSIYA